jgi:hypothetical protein
VLIANYTSDTDFRIGHGSGTPMRRPTSR